MLQGIYLNVFCENNDHDVHFDIMADTAGYGGRTVSPLSGLNRTNDNILLYNHSCTDVLMSCKGISKTI